MERHAKWVLAGVVLAAAQGCTTTESVMRSWVGEHIDKVTEVWGAPETRAGRSDGGAVYTWMTGQCRQSLVVDPQGVVTRWSFNNCPRFTKG